MHSLYKEIIRAHTKDNALLLTPCMKCCHDVSCLCILVDKEENIEWKDKGITMVLYENHLQISSFVNWMW